MTAHSLPRVDWRNNVNGLPLASFDGENIERISKGKDAEAQSAVERCSDRRQIARPKGEAA